MAVTPEQGVAHVGRYAKSFVDELAGLHAASRADGTEPVDVILKRQQAAGSDQSSQEMVVDGNGAGLRGVGVEPLAEPDVLGDDLAGGLYVLTLALLRVRDTPAGRTAGAGLLRQREGNTVDQGTDDESALAIAGAARHTQLSDVDSGSCGAELFETVDDAVDPPGPGSQRTSRVRISEEGVKGALTPGATTVLGGKLVVGEGDTADVARDWQRRAADSDDGSSGTGAGLAERGADRRGLAADGDGDRQGVAA